MKNHPQLFVMPHFAVIAAIVLALFATSCGEQDNPVDPADRLCGGASGFAARVEGRSSPVDVCASDNETTVDLTSGNIYAIRAAVTIDNTLFQFNLEVPYRSDFPVVLDLSADQGAAQLDEYAVWLYYQEVPQSGEALESYEISGGSFTLSFAADDVMTATFADVVLKIRTQESTPQDRGTRVLKRGYMSLSVDS
jgi:hypothetical protein